MSVRHVPGSLGNAHAKRLSKWRNLAPPQTRHLVDGVTEHLVPVFEAQGFQRVDYVLMDRAAPTPASYVVLERVTGEVIDSITFNFEKYRTPRFQIHVSRRTLAPSNSFIRAANLVRKNSQYYCFWGKPWWLPTKFWSSTATQRVLEGLLPVLQQVQPFIERGDRGPNISKVVNIRVSASEA
jgi:hypothetical protein